MTTANLLNVTTVKAGVQVEGSKKLQEENLEAAAIFSALMNQQTEFSDSLTDMGNEQSVISKTESSSTITDSYERFNYKDNKLETVEEKDVIEVTEEVADELQQFEEDVIDAISEEYGVDKETILNVLDEMGLNVLDLLNIQNLTGFVMELTGLTSAEDVLFDESFLSVMETLDNLKTGLMKELGITTTELDELVAQMDVITSENGEAMSFRDVLDSQTEQLQDTVSEDEITTPTQEAENQVVENANRITEGEEVVEQAEIVEQTEIVHGDEIEGNTKVSDEVLKEEEAVGQTLVSSTENKAETSTEDDNRTPFSNADTGENPGMNHQVTNDVNLETPKVQAESYTSVDTMQMIEQVARQIRVYANANTTTMEMMLNPENLGKVYLHISSEEGVVNAQFTATNEAVKEALEAQMATLRENLTQAGVKVDAIEVTIASHEFEQNLEQNHRQSEEENVQERLTLGRRHNLRTDDLDEMSGLMTEEETLVAQMMKENGNSVDFTA